MPSPPYLTDERTMLRTRPTTLLLVATLVLASVPGAGLVAAEDLPDSSDGKLANGEELKTAEDNDDQIFGINYTFALRNHQPGHTDGAVEHYAVGLTENGTLHRIVLYSDDFGFANCEPSNTAAFGIDRGNDEPGTATDVSLLTSYKSYNSDRNTIDIRYYRKERLAGGPIKGYIDDQIVAAQNNCYDNPSEPGWYRINGTITGHNGGSGTTTNYKIRDLSQWIYICECSSRAEAERKLGPPPSGSGDDGGSSTPTATPTATATPNGGGGVGGSGTPTATATPTAIPTPTATPTATAAPNDEGGGVGDVGTATATPGDGGGDAGTATPTATGDSGGGGDGGSTTSTATTTPVGADGSSGGDGPRTPTVGSGPGFGAVAALGGLLVAGLLALRRD